LFERGFAPVDFLRNGVSFFAGLDLAGGR